MEIRLAVGDIEHRDAYRLRSRVFGGERILDRHDTAPLFDIFDALPSSRLVIAVQRGTVVGTVRTTAHGPGPSSCDEYFAPGDSLPNDARICSGSLLCVDREHRTGTLGLRLVDFGMRAMFDIGGTHALAPVRPEVVPLFRRLGWYEVGERFHHSVEGVPVVPMGVTLAERYG